MALKTSNDFYRKGTTHRVVPCVNVLPSSLKAGQSRVNKSNLKTLTFGKARTVFPLGIVCGYHFVDEDLNKRIEQTERRFAREKSVPVDCLYTFSANHQGTLRWGQQIIRSHPALEGEEESASLGSTKWGLVRNCFHKLTSDSIVYNPRARDLCFSAMSLNVKTCKLASRPKTISAINDQQKCLKIVRKSVKVPVKHPEKSTTSLTAVSGEHNFGNDFEAIKVGDGLVIIENSKIVSLRFKVKKKNGFDKATHKSNEIMSFSCIREFNEALQKHDKAQQNLQRCHQQ